MQWSLIQAKERNRKPLRNCNRKLITQQITRSRNGNSILITSGNIIIINEDNKGSLETSSLTIPISAGKPKEDDLHSEDDAIIAPKENNGCKNASERENYKLDLETSEEKPKTIGKAKEDVDENTNDKKVSSEDDCPI